MTRPASDNSYGQAAVRLGYATEAHVHACLQVQAKMREMGIDEPLGEIMVKKGHLTAQQNQNVLKQLGVHISPIPGYTLLGKIGQGGMGTVYKANQTSVNRMVAVKILSRSLGEDKVFVKRFFHEAQEVAHLSHKNLISAIDAGEASGSYFFVMEHVTGRSCREIVNTQGPFEEKKLLDLAIQMAEVLDYIHQHRMIHRDIKPENMILTPEGVLKLCDFGLAKSTSALEQSLTLTGCAVGTPYYMSPEQVRGDKDIDIRCDLYSLGTTLYLLGTGRFPYEGKSAAETMSLHLTQAVPDPRRVAPRMTESMAAVIRKLMAKDRGDRYQRPADLLDDLRRIRQGGAPLLARSHSSRTTIRKAVHQHPTQRMMVVKPTPVWPAAAVGVAVLVLGVIMASSGGRGASRKKSEPEVVVQPAAPSPPTPLPPPSVEDDPQKAAEAGKLFASAEDDIRKEKWEEARAKLEKLKADYSKLRYTKGKAAVISEKITLCSRKLEDAGTRETAEFRQARAAMQTREWKKAKEILQGLADQGRGSYQADLDLCVKELEAEELVRALAEVLKRKQWSELLAKTTDVRARYGITETARGKEKDLIAYQKKAEEEQAVAKLITDGHLAALQSRWDDVSTFLMEVLKKSETETYRERAGEVKDLQGRLDAAAEKDMEAKIKRAWETAEQTYRAGMQEKKYDAATSALQAFAREYASSKFYLSKKDDIRRMIDDANRSRGYERSDQAKKLWGDVQEHRKAKDLQAALNLTNKILTDYADASWVKSSERELLRPFKIQCERELGMGDGFYLTLEFEEEKGPWESAGGCSAAHTTQDSVLGKRSAKLTFRGNGGVWHPIKSLDGRSDTLTFCARPVEKGKAGPVRLTLNTPNGDYSLTETIAGDWKKYEYRLDTFRSEGGTRQPKKLDPERVTGFEITPNGSSNFEILIDSLHVEGRK